MSRGVRMAGAFKAYDIRGVYGKEVDEDLARKVGAIFSAMYPGTIVVGGDVRESTPSLKQAFIEGALSAGGNVVDIGFATTPLVLFATKHLSAAAGANITASHNPAEFNGIKLNDKNGEPISYESGLHKIEASVKENKIPTAQTQGKLENKNILKDYIKFVKGHAPSLKGWKIVVDAGNGVAGLINPDVLEALGAEVVRLYCEPDGRFPNHQPNPEKEDNMRDLAAKVKESGAALGVAYDGDGDRVGFVDENGQTISGTKALCILIKDVLEKNRGAKIVFDVECSKAIEDVIKAAGGIPVICKTGHTYITQRMIEEKAIFAGEKSGHYYFSETQGVDDGLFATVKMLAYLMRTKQTLSQTAAAVPQYISSYKRLQVANDEVKFQMIEQLKEEVVALGHAPTTLDGVRLDFDGGWMLIRASNTEPKLSVTVEGAGREQFEKFESLATELLKKVGVGV